MTNNKHALEEAYNFFEYKGNYYSKKYSLGKYIPQRAYRILNPKDIESLAAGKGIDAKNPDASYTLADFIRTGTVRKTKTGKKSEKKTQFIASCGGIGPAVVNSVRYGDGPHADVLVEIDFDKCQGLFIFDMRSDAVATMKKYPGEPKSHGLKYFEIAAAFTATSQELDIIGHIPQEAVRFISMPEWLSDADNRAWFEKEIKSIL